MLHRKECGSHDRAVGKSNCDGPLREAIMGAGSFDKASKRQRIRCKIFLVDRPAFETAKEGESIVPRFCAAYGYGR